MPACTRVRRAPPPKGLAVKLNSIGRLGLIARVDGRNRSIGSHEWAYSQEPRSPAYPSMRVAPPPNRESCWRSESWRSCPHHDLLITSASVRNRELEHSRSAIGLFGLILRDGGSKGSTTACTRDQPPKLRCERESFEIIVHNCDYKIFLASPSHMSPSILEYEVMYHQVY
jgi:hypothetical protein